MKSRRDFEKSLKPAAMKSLIDNIGKDRRSIPDRDYHRRVGIVKDLLEEYVPLQALAEHTDSDCQAYLTEKSNPGPDGVIVLPTGKNLMVQIAVADQDRQVAWGRERLSEGNVTFPASNKVRNPKTGAIDEQGKVLTTRKDRLKEQITAIETRVRDKNTKFHKGTDILLVSTNIYLSDDDLGYKWEKDLRARIAAIGSPYPKICIYTGKRIIEVYP